MKIVENQLAIKLGHTEHIILDMLAGNQVGRNRNA
jgi:hypothetical protein